MKFSNVLFAVAALLLSAGVLARTGGYVRSLYENLGVDSATIMSLESHPAMLQFLRGASMAYDKPLTGDPVADYETNLPHGSRPQITAFERIVLPAYLENPGDRRLAMVLAIYHLDKSLLKGGRPSGKDVAHTIIAEYFLNRIVELGGNQKWVKTSLEKTGKELHKVIKRQPSLDLSEGHEAHKYFINAFNYNEQNRYTAVAKLFDSFVQNPGNVLTNAYLTASNIWVGGEAGYEDPTVLYNMLLSSYFSMRIVQLAQQAEAAWMVDPVNNQRFRLASILGGWTVPARRWLATLHGDQEATALLDAEHRSWLAINRAFHSASVGLMLFDEPANFWEGFGAWNAGAEHCEELPAIRTCIDSPRISYNLLSFTLGLVDYFIKAGMLDTAQMVLFFRFFPFTHWEGWYLGQEAWLHRETNMQQIHQLYSNGDPSDDPTHFLLKSRKWGADTITCQTCHQAQGRGWTEEEINSPPQLPHESLATIGTWPAVTTTWYGSVQ
jgi:hypothetical protein